MAKISTYNNQSPVELDDKVIGTRASDGKTFNFTIGDVVEKGLTPKYDLPKLPFISCTITEDADPDFGRYITYTTDRIRTLDILRYIPEGRTFFRTAGIIKHDNILLIKTWLDGLEGERGLLKLVINEVNNEYEVGSYEFIDLPTITRDADNIPYNLHSEAIIGDFLYMATRTSASWTAAYEANPTQIFKVNIYDLSDVEEYSLPATSDFLGAVGEMRAYKNQLFLLGRKGQTDGGQMIRIDQDLTNPVKLFSVGTVSTQRITNSCPFEIYNEEFYIPTYYNSSSPPNINANVIGVQVFSMATNTVVREDSQIVISEGRTSGTAPAHWLSIYGGKLLIHSATGSSSLNKRLIRINPYTLELDGPIDSASVEIGYSLTNNNSVISGWIYANPEGSYDTPLIRYWYKDFSIQETLIETGYYSVGSVEYPVNPESLHQFKTVNGETIEGSGDIVIEASITIDSTPTNGSTNAVSSNGVYDALETKEPVISGSGYVFSTGTSKSFVTGNANEVVLANATKENKNTLVNGATLSVLSTTNQAITSGLAYLNIVNQLQGQITGYTAITANTTLTTAHRIIDVTANSITVTLPTAVGIAGRQYTIKNSGSGTTVTIATTLSQTIDGAGSKSLAVQYGGFTVLSDGANWKIIASF